MTPTPTPTAVAEVVGLTADRWDLIVLVVAVALFGLGVMIARSL